METKHESDYPPSPSNGVSDEEDQESENNSFENKQEEPANNNVSALLKRLQSTGALIKKPKQEYYCFTCKEDYTSWAKLEKHLIQHVSLPSIILTKLPSDDEYEPGSGDENWSEDEELPPTPNKEEQKTPQKLNISQILQKTGLSIKKTGDSPQKSNDSALSKLSGLGFTIKKNSTPIKEEKKEPEKPSSAQDLMQRLGKLGGIKLKLKSDGSNSNSFQVVNGLRDFKTSDDEGSGDEGKDEEDEEQDKSAEQEELGEQDSEDELNTTCKSEESDDNIPLVKTKQAQAVSKNQAQIIPKTEPVKTPTKIANPPPQLVKQPGRPAVKQTPKRITTIAAAPQQVRESPVVAQTATASRSNSASNSNEATCNVVVKQEPEPEPVTQSSIPLFSNVIKSERASPPLEERTTPIITVVKTEPGAAAPSQTVFTHQANTYSTGPSVPPPNLLPIAKTEDTTTTIIEINGDSNDEDDDCCVVSATPAPDVKPIIPKTEISAPAYPPPAYSSSSTQPTYPSGNSVLSGRLTAGSTEKQHTFNWNAPDTKPPIDMLEKSADDIFESLLSSTKKENLADANEYISLDTLGPQHSCDVCNTRFTDVSLLEDHIRMTGHSKSIILPSTSSLLPTSATLLPYNPQSNILSSLLPVKQLAEQVGKLSTIGTTGAGFTHQQNVMINIQAYPGAGGVMPAPHGYNAYGQAQNLNQNYSQPNNMYNPNQGQQMPNQYPGQSYMGQQQVYSQYQPPMSKYPGNIPQNTFTNTHTPYSQGNPLQNMQQAYGDPSGMMNQQQGQMGPPISAANHQFIPSSSPSNMKPSPNIKIQNVQTFQPGQLMGPPGQPLSGVSDMGSGHAAPGHITAPGQPMGGQMPSPAPIRMAPGANITGSRPRMSSIRGPRPTIRPGIQVHGQVRGQKPRMPLKRPAGAPAGPGLKRRPDMLLPGKHDNEDCQVMSMQKQRDGLPLISSIQGAKDKLNLGNQLSITKKTVNKEANAMANVLASRGISIKQKQKSRSPTPERPIPHIPNLGAGVSIKHTSKSSNFSIPEAKVGGSMLSCKICKKMFMNYNSLSVHMSAAHPQNKLPLFKCEDCPASYPKILQLQHHKRVFHNVSGPNRELGLPVVDLSQEDNLKRLSNLGIYSFIPLASRDQGGGCFGIPVISVHNAQNGMTSSMLALGADGLLSLGPMKPLPNT